MDGNHLERSICINHNSEIRLDESLRRREGNTSLLKFMGDCDV